MGLVWGLCLALILFSTWSSSLPLRTHNGDQQATQLRLMTKAAESEVLPRRGTASRENEIAAIFRGVAYGAPTQGRPNITTTVPETNDIISQTLSSLLTPKPAADNEKQVKTFIKEVQDPSGYGGQKTSGSERNNHSSLVSEPLDETNTKNAGNKSYISGVVLTDSTFFPLATVHTVYEISNSREIEKKNSSRGSSEKGVSVSELPGYYDLHWSLGLAWWVHLYVSVGLFTLLALVALFLMARVAIVTHLLPRSQYLAVHIFIFFAAFLRSIHILHDVHGMKLFLPITLLRVIEDIGWPCLTAALAFVVVSVLREWKYPKHPHMAFALALVTILQLMTLPVAHITVIFLKHENLPITLTTRAVAVAFGGIVGISGMWAVWRESRDFSPHLADVQVRSNHDNCRNIAHPARLILTAALTQLMLAGLHVYKLLAPVSPERHVWVWWSCLSVSRGLELLVGSTLITAAALTLARPSQCCIFSSCCEKRTVEIVHPTEIKMIHPMGVYTLQSARPKNEHAQTIAALSLSNSQKEKKDHRSLDYVTSDFQLVWNHSRQKPINVAQTAQTLGADDSILYKFPKKGYEETTSAQFLPMNPRSFMDPFVNTNAFSATLPRNRVYLPPPSFLQYQEDIRSSQERVPNYTSKSSTLLSGSSGGSSKLYSSPQIPLRASRSWDELSTSHIYEDLTRAKRDSIEEAISDISDLNSDITNDLSMTGVGSTEEMPSIGMFQFMTQTASYSNINATQQIPAYFSSMTSSKPVTASQRLYSRQPIASSSFTQPSTSHQVDVYKPTEEYSVTMEKSSQKSPLETLPDAQQLFNQNVAIPKPSTKVYTSQKRSGSSKPRDK